ncbi:MAG: TonB-dependent receptor [Verrucomicrobiales bacterium]
MPKQYAWTVAATLIASMGVMAAQEDVPFSILPEVIVVGERRAATDGESRSWTADEIARVNPLTLDAALGNDPSFSLYRRQSSLFANPTSSGVSLRRTGATATSRTLVLRDGIPQNDPFGGWISWTRYDSGMLESLQLVPAGSATVWGNQSAAGTVQLTSRTPERTSGQFRSSVGNHATWAGSVSGDFVSGGGGFALQTNVYTLQSDGFYGLSDSQRGAVDRRLDIDARGLDLRSIYQPTDTFTLESTLSLFEEERGNGTVLSRNSTDAVDFSLRGTWEHEELTHQIVGYYQQRDFAATFSSVNDDRSAETPALDQFDVPGTGLGGGFTTAWNPNDSIGITLGADIRHLTGETNEDAGFVNGAFLRRRRAGGDETFTGAFARAAFTPETGTEIELSGRIDYWSLTNGERVERHPKTNTLLRNDNYPDRDGFEPSLALTLQQEIGDTLTLNTSASTSFRAPTLNELYRPFRVRNDITEGNVELDPERFYSIDAGATWEPTDAFTLSNTFFVHWIHDAIANVPVTDSATAAGLGIFVPADGSLQLRDNVDEARVMGLETRADLKPSDMFNLSLAYQLTDTQFTKSSDQPLLQGNEFPHSPNHQATVSVSGNPTDRLEWFASATYSSNVFDDALAARSLDAYWNTGLGLALEVNDHLTLRAQIDNVLDEEIQTGNASNGLVTIGQPRSFWLTATVEW